MFYFNLTINFTNMMLTILTLMIKIVTLMTIRYRGLRTPGQTNTPSLNRPMAHMITHRYDDDGDELSHIICIITDY